MPFKKGQSGNPAGRKPKSPELLEVESLARTFSKEAIEKLAEWMRSDNPKASVSACHGLLDRGHGKPAQALTIDATVRRDPDSYTDAELAAIAASGRRRDDAEETRH